LKNKFFQTIEKGMGHNMKKLIKKIKNEKGQSIVEFAIVLPVLMLFLCGIIDFGWFFSGKVAINNCSREGARFAVVNTSSPNVLNDMIARINNAAPDSIKSGLVVVMSYTNLQNPSAGDVVVTVKGKMKALTPIAGIFCKDQEISIASTVTMKVE
jgi:Flp pilus assembly protein TadG